MFITSVATCMHMLLPVPYGDTIKKISCQYHINPNVTAAIIRTESKFNPRSISNDPGGKSWGLMQVKLSTARYLGFNGRPKELFNPMVGIRLGVRYLVRQAHRFPYGWDAISAYNKGTPHWYRYKRAYANQTYVNRVNHNYMALIHLERRLPSQDYVDKTLLRGTLYLSSR